MKKKHAKAAPKQRGGFQTIFWFPPCFVALIVIAAKFQPLSNWIGHDYAHAFARLFIGAHHFWTNGFDIPHYTAALCGGIPFIADPQSLYYSVPQWLALFLSPRVAVLLSICIFYVLAYWGTYCLCHGPMNWGKRIAHFLALMFVLNLFSFVHLFEGHLTFLSYLLFPWVLYLLFYEATAFSQRFWRQLTGLSLILIYVLFSGGLHVAFFFFCGVLVLLPYLVRYHCQRQRLGTFCGLAVGTVIAVALACGGKLISSYYYMKLSYVGGIDTSGEAAWEVIARFFWFIPDMTPIFLYFGRQRIGAWEYVGAISKLTIPLLGVYFIFVVANLQWRRIKDLVCFSLTAALAILILLAAQGTSLNLSLPLFRHYHLPIRILNGFLPLIILASGFALNWLEKGLRPLSQRKANALFLAAASLMIFEFSWSADFFLRPGLGSTFYYKTADYELLNVSKGIPRTQWVKTRVRDIGAMANGGTSLTCYEPVFGHALEGLKANLVVGETSLIKDNQFNLTHPGCLLYPEYFQCRAWDRISAEDVKGFEKFVEGRTTEWGVPAWQRWWFVIGFVTIGILCLPWLMALLDCVRSWRKFGGGRDRTDDF